MTELTNYSHSYTVRKELERMVEKGEIKKFIRETTKEYGVVFYVETDQGWNPDPFWQEIHML